MKKKKIIIIALILFILSIAWGVRVICLNKEVKNLTSDSLQKYEEIGEWVEFGENYLMDSYCNGYSIRIDDFRIVEYEKYIKEMSTLGYQENDVSGCKPEKVLEVGITLKNEENVDIGIPFLSAWLVGQDFYSVLNPEWFDAVNNLKESGGGIKLHNNTEFKLKLPYPILDSTYREKYRRKLKKEKLWLCITRYPEQRWVRVQ